MDIDVAIENYVDYATYLKDRWYLCHAHGAPEEMERLKSRHRLGDDASWTEVVDAKIRAHVRYNQLLKSHERGLEGIRREIGADGVFVPFRRKTVYVRKGSITSRSGIPDWVEHELSLRFTGGKPTGEIPSDVVLSR